MLWLGSPKLVLLIAAATVVALLAGSFLFAWSGVYNVGASAGHWAVTRWLLHFSMRQSVETRSIGIEAPDLDDLALIEQGAGHFHTGCAPCHGTVEGDPPAIPQGMTPHPPLLPPVIDEWTNEELFWVVKHGIKYTGMPAWPTQARDDEVWAMIAFLRRLPQLDAEGYGRLALGELSEQAPGPFSSSRLAALGGTPAAGIEDCARCHGLDGLGRPSGAAPKLAGLSEEYLYRSLRNYAAGTRPSGIMGPIADGLGEEQRQQLSAYYAALPAGYAATSNPEKPLFELGQLIAAEGKPSENIPNCESCHGTAANPEYPRIGGQPRLYLEEQLRLFRQGIRSGTSYADIMTSVAQELEDSHIAALSEYYSALSPAGQPRD